MSDEVFNLEWKGRFARLRELYLKERSEQRELELTHLLSDTEYLISELHRLERRARIFSFVSTQLRNFAIRLLFYHELKYGKRNVRRFVIKMVNKFFQAEKNIYKIIYSPDLEDYWFLQETEGGKELDIYIPPDKIYHPKTEDIRIDKKKLSRVPKARLIEIICEMDAELRSIKRSYL